MEITVCADALSKKLLLDSGIPEVHLDEVLGKTFEAEAPMFWSDMWPVLYLIKTESHEWLVSGACVSKVEP